MFISNGLEIWNLTVDNSSKLVTQLYYRVNGSNVPYAILEVPVEKQKTLRQLMDETGAAMDQYVADLI